MAITNHERVGKALDIFVKGFSSFVERELQSVFAKDWKDQIDGGYSKTVDWDTTRLINTLLAHWNQVFAKTLGNSDRSLAHEIRDFRNKWAHQQKFSYDDVYRALDSIGRLLTAVSAGEHASEIEKQKQEILRVRFDEQRRTDQRHYS